MTHHHRRHAFEILMEFHALAMFRPDVTGMLLWSATNRLRATETVPPLLLFSILRHRKLNTNINKLAKLEVIQ
jgi:hypothetical protein